ncbi:MAG: nucleoid-associated protein [Cytophagales bacterium]
MLLTSEAQIDQLVVHFVGNKSQEEGFKLSKSTISIAEDNLSELLKKYFLQPFKNQEYFHFKHETDLNLNEIYNYCDKVFADPDSFYLQTINITKHLYEQSTHPNVKSGEFYLVYFIGIKLDDETTDAIGLFKSETKETFLKVNQVVDNFDIETDNGININKLDKGCLIFNTDKEKGFRVCIVDNLNRGSEAQYWKDKFLNVIPRKDGYHYTNNYLDLCKNFVTEQMPAEFEVQKTDQIDMLNRSVNFFKKKENFDFNEFTNDVIQETQLIESFKDYKSRFQKERDVSIVDEFDISERAVKKQARVFKSVLKLDKNFHIYIHGNKELIEKGVDETTGMKFYKIYYKEES